MFLALKTLPREARDTLFLLTVIAWVIAPQVNELPLWCSAMAAAVLLWRGYLAVRGLPLPSRWWLATLLLLAAGGTYFSHRTLLGRDAGVTLIVVLLALKTLELRAQRDAFVVFFLGFFTLLSNFFYSQSLPLAASMLLGVLGLLTALVLSHMPVGKPPLWQAARTAGWMTLIGAPIMATLFVLFPRVAPLWGVPADAMSGRSGLSNSMQVGTIASLALDSSVAMRIRFEDTMPPQSALYFRGPVLSSFDGRSWTPLQSMFSERQQLGSALEVSGPALRYTVTLEGNQRPWLPVLDATSTAPIMVGYTPRMTPALQWVVDQPIADLVRYQVQSHTQFRHGPSRTVSGLQDYRALPFGSNPRTVQLAASLRADPRYSRSALRESGSEFNAAMVAAALERLRTGGYQYTLEPGVFGQHTADEFWFDRKEGFCEHIASSFVVLMRALDIPARIVTGYQGGERNSVDGLWTVRQSDAHAWAEVWMPERGWVRVDPTSAVAPGRTGTLTRLEPPRNIVTQTLITMSPAFALNLRAMWEAMNNNWNQWVLNYSQAKQLNLLRNIGFESPSWEDLGYVLIALVVAAALMGGAWTLWERHHQDPWLRLLHLAHQQLGAAGLALPPQAPPRQVAAMLQAHTPTLPAPQMAALCDWLLRLEAWRYAPPGPGRKERGPTRLQLGTLAREFKQLPWPARTP